MSKQTIDNSFVLLVEGDSDKHAFIHIASPDPNISDFCIRVCSSVDNAIDQLGVLALDDRLLALGIAVDANESPGLRWRRIVEELHSVGIRLPKNPEPDGTIVEGKGHLPRVGVWMLPNNCSRGELEDLVGMMIADNDPIWPLANAYIDGIPSKDRPFDSTKTKVNKAKVYAWLATRKKPGLIGKAIGSEALDKGVDDVRTLSRWLAGLFPVC